MAEETQNKYETSESSHVEVQDRGVFDYLSKKKEEEEKPHEEEVIVTEFEKVTVSEEGDKKHSLLDKLHRSDTSSSSSSEEEGEDGEKRKKKKKEKKGLKEKIEDTSVPVEKVEVVETPHPEEKKGFLDKIKEKLPGHKKTEEATHPPPPPPPPAASSDHGEGAHHEGEAKEKKGILEKIKEKLPGYHPKTEDEKEKESGAH